MRTASRGGANRRSASSESFGGACGACGAACGLLLAAQFLLARPLLDLPRLSSGVQLQVLLVTLVAALVAV